MTGTKQSFWSMSIDDVFSQLKTGNEGLKNDEAQKRLVTYGTNSIKPKKNNSLIGHLLSQFKSPIILILLFAIGLSFFLKDTVDAFIILTIVLVSGLLGFWQEYSASSAVEKLLALVQIKATVLRNSLSTEVSVEEIVPGDVVILKAGDIIAAIHFLLMKQL
jgi:Mg2+-importing ATPase